MLIIINKCNQVASILCHLSCYRALHPFGAGHEEAAELPNVLPEGGGARDQRGHPPHQGGRGLQNLRHLPHRKFSMIIFIVMYVIYQIY